MRIALDGLEEGLHGVLIVVGVVSSQTDGGVHDGCDLVLVLLEGSVVNTCRLLQLVEASERLLSGLRRLSVFLSQCLLLDSGLSGGCLRARAKNVRGDDGCLFVVGVGLHHALSDVEHAVLIAGGLISGEELVESFFLDDGVGILLKEGFDRLRFSFRIRLSNGAGVSLILGLVFNHQLLLLALTRCGLLRGRSYCAGCSHRRQQGNG